MATARPALMSFPQEDKNYTHQTLISEYNGIHMYVYIFRPSCRILMFRSVAYKAAFLVMCRVSLFQNDAEENDTANQRRASLKMGSMR